MIGKWPRLFRSCRLCNHVPHGKAKHPGGPEKQLQRELEFLQWTHHHALFTHRDTRDETQEGQITTRLGVWCVVCEHLVPDKRACDSP
jgi:hypothetical protein